MKEPLPLDSIALKATAIRQSIITMLAKAGSGHSAGALGMADVFAALYFHVLKHDPSRPQTPDRDRLLLSNGHICPVLYATLAEAGYFPVAELQTLRQLNSRLQGHPHLGSLPGVENTSGPLGQGLSQAAGLALSLRMDTLPNHVFCITSDGEHNEGQTWEAYLLAAKYHLGNLTVLIDRNQIQIEGRTEEILPLEPFSAKLETFGWHVQEIDGNNLEEIIKACEVAQSSKDQPCAIVCQTVPGKGVSFMENDYRWHGEPPNQEQAEQALAELRQAAESRTHD